MADAQTSERVVAGRYRLIEPLGRGGMGTVWRAVDGVLEREVAVKELLGAAALTGPDRETFLVRTFREARAAGRLSHPSVASVYDVFEENGHPWIVLQLVQSRTLGALIQDEGPLPPRRVAEIGGQVLAALSTAHAAGVLHRDVKPDNVLITDEGRAVLTDFGIAAMDDDSSLTHTGMLVGTPAFVAPERAAGDQAERASDLWSLGVTMFMAAEGRSPFHRGNALATLAAVMYEDPGPMHNAGPLAPVISGLLVKDPAHRMTAEEAAGRLHSVASGLVADQAELGNAAIGPLVPAQRPHPRRTPVPATPGYWASSPSTPSPAPWGATRQVPLNALIGATALVVLVGLAVGGLAFMTARTDAVEVPGSSISTPTVTVYATRTARPPAEKTAEPVAGPGAGTGPGTVTRPVPRAVTDGYARPSGRQPETGKARAPSRKPTGKPGGHRRGDHPRDGDRPGQNKPGANRPGTSKPDADKPGSDRSPSGSSGSEGGKIEPSEGGNGGGDNGGRSEKGDRGRGKSGDQAWR